MVRKSIVPDFYQLKLRLSQILFLKFITMSDVLCQFIHYLVHYTKSGIIKRK